MSKWQNYQKQSMWYSFFMIINIPGLFLVFFVENLLNYSAKTHFNFFVEPLFEQKDITFPSITLNDDHYFDEFCYR